MWTEEGMPPWCFQNGLALACSHWTTVLLRPLLGQVSQVPDTLPIR